LGIEIYIKPADVFDFFSDNPKRMVNELVAIAENEETDHTVYLTDDGKGFPLFEVHKGEKSVHKEATISAADCEETAQMLYRKFLFPVTASGDKYFKESPQEDDGSELSDAYIEETILGREDCLSFALGDFLETVLNMKLGLINSIYGLNFMSEVLDDFCEYLASDHGISVYRPTIVPGDNDGVDVYTEHPYKELAGSLGDDEEDIEI
jgi:hypothetical protein